MTEKTKRVVITAITGVICAVVGGGAIASFQSTATATANANAQVIIDGKMVTVETKRLQEYYNNLSTEYDKLLSEHTTLQNDMDELSGQYRVLTDNYNQLLLKDSDLQDRFVLLQKELAELKNSSKATSENKDNGESEVLIGQETFLTDTAPAYQSERYAEYSSNNGDGSSFSMAGKKYLDGGVWACGYESFSIYPLDGKYTKISGVLGHVDGTDMNSTTMQVFVDGKLKEEIQLTGDMMAKEYFIDVANVNQLKIVVLKTGGYPKYGYGNITIS